ncbi:MAG TPA: tRNA (N6-isopentenyl adenosine(37)-C2)-methylthiotransferase MiaB [Deltaproteobacteria bacterium]|nr:tRNA (N6-isopentenyl adenosine(37)-C2)-methylthiotransferase MiaB [Deltaproteobacteria bacterium]HPR54958.1 tRNA (N6-isopentenyl adenosine(37)-C2)-methylthiotransferase MiaB [Deltaproteobacteria bacterium]HXK46296.1 tRNA (N6-isopentenyl adenosine(37)-C2)-methylthiotransferase MiaB [Deltaproteobacteria bacterium]
MNGRVKIFTYGCQMNDLDSQKLYSELAKKGFLPTEETKDADVIVINTCSVRQKAYEKAISNLGRLKAHKRVKPSLIIAITGCVAQQEGEGLRERMPHIDIVLGTHQLHRLPDLVNRVHRHSLPVAETAFSDCIPFLDTIPGAAFSNQPHRAYINIMQGCDNYCSYCIVPYVRGREISRDYRKILDEVRLHARRGVKEIFLLGQNVNSYQGGMAFPELLRHIHGIEGIERIRFTTSHPKDVSDDLIACFRDMEKLCSHIHLPFQSGSDKVLKAMNRHYTHRSYLDLIARLRDARPDMAFSADVMVGFPDERDVDFRDTLDILESVRFDVLYSFKYSVRPGTAAAELGDNIPVEDKVERLRVLQAMQKKITIENNRRRIGGTYAVLVDGNSQKNSEQIYGRTSHNAIVNFTGATALIGEIVSVKITRANPNSLTGEIS